MGRLGVWTLCALLLAAPMVGCAEGGAVSAPEQGIATWVTYWDPPAALEEALPLAGRMERLVYFAAYFDAEDTPFVPAELYDFYDRTQALFPDAMPRRSLSVVNDLLLADGGSSLKDTKLLWRLFDSAQSMRSHAEDLISLARFDGFDGIEIDYEALGKDMALWERFTVFLQEMYGQAQAAGLHLRVMLEPGAPIASLDFPAGPDYVMMCYNLYGSHGGPGPKANDAFLNQMVDKMSTLPGVKRFALATGGFDWSRGSTKALTQQTAEDMAATYGAMPQRDGDSGAMHFDYQDAQGADHTVWYADGETLARWRGIIDGFGAGYGVDIWRLGGNDQVSLWLGAQ